LVTGRILEHYQSGAQTRRVPELNDANAIVTAQIHPATAADRGIADGAGVRVANARGSLVARAILTADIRPDTVFVPFHFAGDESANLLTNSAVDPVSGMPEFKHTVVQIAPA
ncbi:MAG: molybdopterin dinucleotide binding domain-containing protein, partial [Microbacterium gubbeenense]